jgi:hypothetical protein
MIDVTMFRKAATSVFLSGLLGGISHADEAKNDTRPPSPAPASQSGLVQSDPRYPAGGVALLFTRGTKPEKNDHGAYIVIAWAHPPAGSNLRGYQFWGDNRIVDQKAIELALDTVLKERPRNVFVLGNDWAAGRELDTSLQKLSKSFQIDVIGGSTFRFDKVDFREEREEVRNLISKAIDRAQKSPQAAPSNIDNQSN